MAKWRKPWRAPEREPFFFTILPIPGNSFCQQFGIVPCGMGVVCQGVTDYWHNCSISIAILYAGGPAKGRELCGVGCPSRGVRGVLTIKLLHYGN